MALITCGQIARSAEKFINEHNDDLPIRIGVTVIDNIVPGEAGLLLMENPPTAFLATMLYGAGVSLLRTAKRVEQRAREQ